MATKRPPLPLILLANDLLDGDVVVRTADGWSLDPAAALVATTEAEAAALEAAGAAAAAARQIVDPVLVDVTVVAGRAIPNHVRERLRLLGPSIRADLGKQAVFPTSFGA